MLKVLLILVLAYILFEFVEDDSLRVESVVNTVGQTGVEMEALTACSVAGLAVYDMCKSIDRRMTLGPLQLEEKSGGVSGDFHRDSGGNTT